MKSQIALGFAFLLLGLIWSTILVTYAWAIADAFAILAMSLGVTGLCSRAASTDVKVVFGILSALSFVPLVGATFF